MSSGTVSRWKYFARNDESRHVGSKVLEKASDTIDEEKGFLRSHSRVQLIVSKPCPNSSINRIDIVKEHGPQTHDSKEDSEHCETHELDSFATPEIDDGHRRIITGDQSSGGYDHVASANII